MSHQMFVNLPIRDMARSQAFFKSLGFAFNPRFTNDQGACMVVSENHHYVMLLVEPFFQTFTKLPVGDARTSTQVLIALSCDSRTAVDAMVARAVAAGATTPNAPQDHSRVAFLPYVPYTRKVLIHKGTRVKPAGTPVTTGEHILKKRLKDGLTRAELAPRLGVDAFTVMNWELGRTKAVPVKAMPAVLAYLGYNPETTPEGVGAQLRWRRRSLGWTTREAAHRHSVDPSTWGQWEKQEGWPAYPRYRELVAGFLDLPAGQLVGIVRQATKAPSRRGKKEATDVGTDDKGRPWHFK